MGYSADKVVIIVNKHTDQCKKMGFFWAGGSDMNPNGTGAMGGGGWETWGTVGLDNN